MHDHDAPTPNKTLVLLLFPIIVLVSSILLQLRLSALGLSPTKFELPALPDLPERNDWLANFHVEKIGVNELAYPESIVHGRRFKRSFISLGDGRIMRMNWDNLSWSPLLRTGGPKIIGKFKNGTTFLEDSSCGKGGPADTNSMEHKCGRPLGLWLSNRASVDPDYIVEEEPHHNNYKATDFSQDEDVLIVADAYKGLLMVTGIYGGQDRVKMHVLATRSKTDPPDYKFSLLNSVVQTQNGDIYFTETSQKFQRRRIFHAAIDGTPTGRLLRYRREKGEVEVLAENIYIANGIALTHSGSGLLIVSGVSVLRYDLNKGEMDNRPFVEVMPGTGDNIKTMSHLPNGETMNCYWLAMGGKYAKPFSLLKFLSDKPWITSFLLSLVPYPKLIDFIPKWTALAVYDQRGQLLQTLIDDGKMDGSGKKIVTAPWISEVEPIGDYLYLLSWYNPFLGRISKSSLGY